MTQKFSQHRMGDQVSIVGQVKDAITHQGIAFATVKITTAPVEWIEQILFKIKLFGLPISQIKCYALDILNSSRNRLFSEEFREFASSVERTQDNRVNLVQILQKFLDDSAFTHQQKFQVLQQVLDCIPLNLNHRNADLERTQAFSDGWFYFVDLPVGGYQLEATLPENGMGYSIAQATVEIDETLTQLSCLERYSALFNQKVNLELQPTILLGKVVSAADNEAIAQARIQIAETGEYTLSVEEFVKHLEQEWNYQFIGIPASLSPITLKLSAPGYAPTHTEISLKPGAMNRLDFQLVHA